MRGVVPGGRRFARGAVEPSGAQRHAQRDSHGGTQRDSHAAPVGADRGAARRFRRAFCLWRAFRLERALQPQVALCLFRAVSRRFDPALRGACVVRRAF